jgi:hypothetical protein
MGWMVAKYGRDGMSKNNMWYVSGESSSAPQSPETWHQSLTLELGLGEVFPRKLGKRGMVAMIWGAHKFNSTLKKT